MLFFIDNKPNLKYYIDELQSMQNAHIAELSRRGRFLSLGNG